MKKVKTDPENPDMLDEYDFSGGVRGKYADRFAGSANVVSGTVVKKPSRKAAAQRAALK